MDSIDDITIESEDDGLHLILEGDFVRACERYLADPNLMHIELKISTNLLYEFAKEVRWP